MAQISFRQVSKFFGKVQALNGIHFTIEQGELFFLLGPSGCGKTTLLRLVAGFEQPDQGSILFDQRDVSSQPPQGRNTAMVFQNYALWPHMTVSQNLAFGLEMHRVSAKEREERVRKALSLVKIEALGERLPQQLSGGQQQRVALARALVLEPAVVLFDEPLSNLDTKLRLEMRHEIKRLHSSLKSTMVYVTHDQGEALSLADRIAVLKDGVLAQIGTPTEIYRSPQNAFVAQFIGEANIFPVTKLENKQSLTLETPLGKFHSVRALPKDGTNSQLNICLRPEDFFVLSAQYGSNQVNRLNLQIEELMYVGTHFSALCRAENISLRLNLPANSGLKFQVGQSVEVSVNPEDVVIFAG